MAPLRNFMETDSDWNAWEERLMSCEKEELAQCILSHMANDPHFMKLVYARFGQKQTADEEETAAQISFYAQEVETEAYTKVPDVDYLKSLTERFFETINGMNFPMGKIKAYCQVIIKLDEAINNGAGMYGDDDWLLFDEMDDARKFLVKTVQNLSVKDRETAQKIIREQLDVYKPVADNYIQMALDELGRG